MGAREGGTGWRLRARDLQAKPSLASGAIPEKKHRREQEAT